MNTFSDTVPVYISADGLPDLLATREPALQRAFAQSEAARGNDGTPDASTEHEEQR